MDSPIAARAATDIPKTFYPKPGENNGGWQVFWLVSANAPSHVTEHSGLVHSHLPGGTGPETYSSGYCPGFTPVFPFHPGVSHRKPTTGVKVAEL